MRELRPVLCLTCICGNAIMDGDTLCVRVCVSVLLTYNPSVEGKGSYPYFFIFFYFATSAALRR